MALTWKKLLGKVEFADNPEPRCAVALVLDTSHSMNGEKIAQLNKGLLEFERALKIDRLASLRIEVAVITFGGTVQALSVSQGGYQPIPFEAAKAFVTIKDFSPPQLETKGDTPMGEAVTRAITLVNERKNIYKKHGVDYFRPWIIVITDGKPTDFNWESSARLAREEQTKKALSFYAIGVEGADMDILAQFSLENKPLPLKGLAFLELFQWLSKSLLVVAQSRPGGQQPLPPVDGWTSSSESE